MQSVCGTKEEGVRPQKKWLQLTLCEMIGKIIFACNWRVTLLSRNKAGCSRILP